MTNPIFPSVGLDGKIRDEHLPTRLQDAAQAVGFTRVVASTDRNEPIEPGDLLLIFEPEKTFFDLSTNGLDLLTPQFVESADWSSQAGYVMHAAADLALRTGMAVHTVDDTRPVSEVEVVVKMRSPAYVGGIGPAVAVRCSGPVGSENAVMYGLSQTRATLGRYRNGSWLNLAYGGWGSPVDGEWVWMRLRASGNEIFARRWADGTTEPSEWEVTYTLSDSQPELLSPGWAGVMASSTAEHNFAAIGVALDGGTAPTQEEV